MLTGLNLLGLKVKDRVTGFSGVVTSISFDLYGCVQALINPGTDKEGKTKDMLWLDLQRLEVTNRKPVMAVPTFGAEKGPEAKPIP